MKNHSYFCHIKNKGKIVKKRELKSKHDSKDVYFLKNRFSF